MRSQRSMLRILLIDAIVDPTTQPYTLKNHMTLNFPHKSQQGRPLFRETIQNESTENIRWFKFVMKHQSGSTPKYIVTETMWIF